MKPLKRISLKDIVVQKLHKYTAEHQLQPGDRFLNEKEIISLTGVSRTVAREAIKAMEAVGVLRIKPGDGIFVSEASVEHLINQFSFRWSQDRARMLELLETRMMLELSAIELIVRRLDEMDEMDEMGENPDVTTAHFKDIDANIERMAEGIRRHKPIVETDIEFHRLLFKLTGNQIFYEMSEVITQFFNEVRARRLAMAEGYGNVITEHEQIVQFLKQKDAEGAKRVMVKHLNPLQEVIANDQY